jgi:phospholipid/cholesterol/gamma-HCH transport system ATP-binding protein
MEKNNIIEVKNLSVSFEEREVLTDVSFTVQPEQITVILGGSGSGKTTILKHLLNLYSSPENTTFIFNKDVAGLSEEEQTEFYLKMGVFYQNGALINSLKVIENVALPLEQHTSLPEDIIRQMVLMKLGLVNLKDAAHLYPAQLSGGMLKRAALARAIIMDPPLLFCDEPGAGLDPVSLALLDQLILDLRKQLGMTIVMITHEVSSILRVADKIVFLEKGKIIFEGAKKEALASDIESVQDFFGKGTGK